MVPHGVHIVCTCAAEIKSMMSEHMQEAWQPYRKYIWMSNRTWGRRMDLRAGQILLQHGPGAMYIYSG